MYLQAEERLPRLGNWTEIFAAQGKSDAAQEGLKYATLEECSKESSKWRLHAGLVSLVDGAKIGGHRKKGAGKKAVQGVKVQLLSGAG